MKLLCSASKKQLYSASTYTYMPLSTERISFTLTKFKYSERSEKEKFCISPSVSQNCMRETDTVLELVDTLNAFKVVKASRREVCVDIFDCKRIVL